MRARALLLFLGALASSAAAGAEDAAPGTRAEQWARLRREKAAAPPPHPGFLERQLLAMEKAEKPSIFDINLEGVYPRLQYIASGSELAAGVRLWRPDMGDSLIDLHASAFYSIRGYEYYDLQLGRMAHRGTGLPARSTSSDDVYEIGDVTRVQTGRVVLYGSARYRHYPQTAFYGLGSDSQPEGRTNFLNQDALYEVVTGYQGPRGAATVSAGLMQAFVGPGTDDDAPTIRALYDDQSAPGLDRQPDFIRLAASLVRDWRDQPGNPHRGGLIALTAARFDERGGDEFTFDRIAGDARAYLSLGSPQRVLALRALAFADRPVSGARVPFYLQEGLGGGHTLRGFRTYRFRGEKVVLFQAEYRWEAWPALEFALFADAGRAFGHGEDFAITGLRTDYGIGVRLKTHQAVVARFDIGRSNELTRYLFRFSPSF